MLLLVDGCAQCPLARLTVVGRECLIARRQIVGVETPEWCPASAGVSIRLAPSQSRARTPRLDDAALAVKCAEATRQASNYELASDRRRVRIPDPSES